MRLAVRGKLRLADVVFVTCGDCNIPEPDFGSQSAPWLERIGFIVHQANNSIRMRISIAFAAAVAFAACAPEPTTPSSESLAGVWTSSAHLYSLSDFRLSLVQEPRGIVSGSWSAKSDSVDGGCLPSTDCEESGDVIGRNTVAQVEIQLLGAGRFEGSHVEQNQLRGIYVVGESFDTITFVRTGQ